MLVRVDHAGSSPGSGARASTSPRLRSARQNSAESDARTSRRNCAPPRRWRSPPPRSRRRDAPAGTAARRPAAAPSNSSHNVSSRRTRSSTSAGGACVVVVRLRAGARTGGENSGIERPAADDRHAALSASGQQFLERGLLEQRVAAREQDAVELDSCSSMSRQTATRSRRCRWRARCRRPRARAARDSRRRRTGGCTWHCDRRA